jgi:PAS domain-containing protein
MNGRLVWIPLCLAGIVALAVSLAKLPAWLAAFLPLAAGTLGYAWVVLKQNETTQARLASINVAIDGSELAMLILDAQGKLCRANAAFLRLSMLEENLPALAAQKLLPEVWWNFAQNLAASTLQSGHNSAEIMLPRGDRTALLRAHALGYTDTDDRQKVLILWEDIGGQAKVLHEALQREKQLLARSQTFIQSLIDVIPHPVYIKQLEDGESRYRMINEAFCKFHGRSRGGLLGLTTEELLGDTALGNAVTQEDKKVLEGRLLSLERETLSTSTGKASHTLVSKQACTDPAGHPVVVGTNYDITPWRAAEQNLKSALQREVEHREQVQSFIQRLIDMIPYPVHLKDSRGRYQMVNDAFVRDRGCSREQLLGHDSVEVAKAVDNQLLGAPDAKWERAQLSMEEDNAVLAGKTIVKEEHNTHPVTGAERFRTVHKRGGLDADGLPVIATAFFDVTKWRLAERALADSLAREKSMHERTQDFLQRLIDLIPEEFYVKDADSRYLLVNKAFLRRRGLENRQQAVGRSMQEVVLTSCQNNPVYQADPDLLAAALRDHNERIEISRAEDLEVLAGHTIVKEDHHVLPHSGEESFFEVVKMALTDAAGLPVIVCANFNITPLRQAQRQLQTLQNAASGTPEAQLGSTHPASPASAC